MHKKYLLKYLGNLNIKLNIIIICLIFIVYIILVWPDKMNKFYYRLILLQINFNSCVKF